MSVLLSEIANIVGASGNYNKIEINWLLTDSRSLSFPAESLFFALKSERNNGHNYIQELYQQNLRYFVVSEMRTEFANMQDARFLVVENTLQALQQVCSVHRSKFNIPIIGITGSNGKTVIKEWLYQLLQSDYKITRSPRSYNSQIGVPLSVWGLNDTTELGIFEAGISQPNEMLKLAQILKPTIGIFTNLGEAHQENFQSLKQKCAEKMQLFTHCETLIVNADNKLVDISIAQMNLKAQIFSWGKSEKATMQLLSVRKKDSITQLDITFKTNTFTISIPFNDEASIENAMHCVALLLVLGYKPEQIAERTQKLESVAMRLDVKQGIRNCVLINDSYNSDLNSLNIAVDFLIQQSTTSQTSKTLILSDILQTGLSPAELYSKVAGYLKNKDIQRFIGIGPIISQHAECFSFLQSAFFADTESFLKSELLFDLHNELILLKGARSFEFEKISEKLELIAHETILEVNLNALIQNLNYFRSKLKPDTKVMCMVKAFAYGSGAVEVARTLQHHRCDYVAVAVADEGAELRREGIRIPIAVMNPELGSFGLIFDHKLEPEIYNFRLLNHFIDAAKKQGITDYPIHIKIDSGMHRLGFEMEDMTQLIQILKHQQQVKVRSVFSHLAGADDSKLDSFTHEQVSLFSNCADLLQQAFTHQIMRHILNSAGTERFPQYQFDMVRLGIGHYGISAIQGQKLPQVCALKTIILQLKNIKAGQTVGYNRKGIVDREKQIAILPIGYADGFDRKLSNGVGQVLVNGQRAKVIGNVSMDLIAIDVTGMNAHEGDSVEVFGENLTITEVASWLNTIPYEILTSVSRRVKRIYYQE